MKFSPLTYRMFGTESRLKNSQFSDGLNVRNVTEALLFWSFDVKFNKEPRGICSPDVLTVEQCSELFFLVLSLNVRKESGWSTFLSAASNCCIQGP